MTDPIFKPLVSVVVCTYNQENYLSQTLDSILSQITDFPFEIILSDDCSTDKTHVICEKYANDYPEIIKYYRNQKNKGAVKNYFDSIRLARGKFIADLAGDDIWTYDNKLSDQVKLMETDSSIVLCHCAWKKFTDDGTVIPPTGFYMPHSSRIVDGSTVLPSLLRHEKNQYFVHLCTAVYRKDVVLELIENYPQLFADRNLPCEDFQLVCMLATKGKFAYIPVNALHYRVGHVSLSSTEDAGKVASFVCGVIKLTLLVCDVLHIERSFIESYCRFNIQYALIHAFISDDIDIKRSTMGYAKTLEKISGLDFKTKITLYLLSHKIIGKAARYIYLKLK